jgi:hypothetical protein
LLPFFLPKPMLRLGDQFQLESSEKHRQLGFVPLKREEEYWFLDVGCKQIVAVGGYLLAMYIEDKRPINAKNIAYQY